MRITKYTHSCLRLEHRGRTLVLDPGTASEPAALDGVDAVLLTHEHADHVDIGRLAELGVPVFAPAGADLGPLPTTRVTAGEQITVAGFRVRAVGGRHATVSGEPPGVANLGYLVDGDVYHPGDALHVPGQPVRTLLVPVRGRWMTLDEAVRFAVAVAPQRAIAIHDGGLGGEELRAVNERFGRDTDCGYTYLAPGQSVS